MNNLTMYVQASLVQYWGGSLSKRMSIVMIMLNDDGGSRDWLMRVLG